MALDTYRARGHPLLLTLLMLLLSAIIHYPGFFYSDVVSIYYRLFVERRGWYTQGEWGIPYRDYFLEYPPVVGLTWLLSTLPTALLGVELGLVAHYAIQASILVASGLAAGYGVYRIGGAGPLIVYSVLPTTVVYGVYNWDLIASMFTVWGIHFYLRGMHAYSGLMLGLGAATKLYPGLAALALALIDRRASKVLIVASATFAASFASAAALNPSWPLEFYRYHSGWYIEGSWLLLLARGAFDYDIVSLSKILMASSLLAAATIIKSSRPGPVEASLILVGLPLFSSYVYTPQMNLMVTPLIALASQRVAGLDRVLVAQDTAASLVIITWFTVEDPLGRFSPPSLLSYIKCFLLVYMVASVAVRGASSDGRVGRECYHAGSG